MRFAFWLYVLAAILVLAIAGCGTGSSVSATSTSDKFDGASFPPRVRTPSFTLTDQYGRRVSLSAYHGQVVALTFLSADCRACVLVAQQVRGALDELESHQPAAAGVRTIFVSTDPLADTRARVRRFLQDTSLSSRAEYLTGTPSQLRPVWRAYRVVPAGAGKTAAEDAITVLLLDKDGLERVGFGIEQITPEGLAHDIRLLLAA
jgi:protein SCO1/2